MALLTHRQQQIVDAIHKAVLTRSQRNWALSHLDFGMWVAPGVKVHTDGSRCFDQKIHRKGPERQCKTCRSTPKQSAEELITMASRLTFEPGPNRVMRIVI